MFKSEDHSVVVNSADLPQPTSCIGRPYDEKLVEAALLDDVTKALLENGSPDFWNAVEDWMLD
jgi:hypothetical protein